MNKEETVKRIFKMRNQGCTLQKIGDEFGLTKEYIRQVLNGRHFKDVINKYDLKFDQTSAKLAALNFSKKEIVKIISLIEDGNTAREISKKLNCSPSTIHAVFSNDTYKQVIESLNHDPLEIKIKLNRNFKNLTDDELVEIFNLVKTKGQKEVARIMNISQTLVSGILRGEKYARDIKRLGLKPIRNEFTEREIIQIFTLYNQGISATKLAEIFNYTCSGILNILNGKSGVYLDFIKKNGLKKIQKVKNEHKRKLSENDILEIFRLKHDIGLSNIEISSIFKISTQPVYQILKGLSYKDVIDKHNLLHKYKTLSHV